MDAAQMLQDLLGGLKAQLGHDFGTIKDFAERQGRMLASQAELIAKSRAQGDLPDDDFYAFLLKGLEDNAANMARSIAVLTLLTIEKAWNAIANALWGGMRVILIGAGLPGPLIPAAPPAMG